MGVIKNIIGKKVYYRPQGFLDSSLAAEIITPLDIQFFEKRGIKCVLIDFLKIISANMKSIKELNSMLEILYKKDIECAIFNVNKNTLNVIKNLKNIYFHYFESEIILKLFCDEDYLEYRQICISKKNEDRDTILFNLVKKGYNPKIVEDFSECDEDAIKIEKTFMSRVFNNVSGMVKDNVVYFYFDGFLDREIEKHFDLEYFRRMLLIGFRVFVFDMNNVKGLNIHAVNFLSKLGVEAAEYSALMAIVGLDKKILKERFKEELEFVNYLFFKDMNELISSEEYKDAIENVEIVYKRSKLTKNFIKLLPFFVNATISTIELMTGVEATKEPPKIKEVNLDFDKEYVASSIGFYGDNDGVMILVFTKELAKKISYILIGEEFESDEELSDMLGEFANIIVGSVKRELKKHEVNINLTLPKLFNDIENLKKLVYKRKGVEVKFYFKNEEFYFYLIR